MIKLPNTYIPVVFSSDDYYVPYMSTMMQSIMENAGRDRMYVFFILYREITNDNMDLLKKQVALFPHFLIEFIDVSDYIKEYNFYISEHITIETYFRLLIPYIFSEYPKVIYLDGDMICRTDIALLFDTDMTNYLLAAVRDSDVARYYSPKDADYMKFNHTVMLSLRDPSTYFNGGLIIFNTALFRETISVNELLELAQSREWQCHDQDILNFLADGKTVLLPYHWNFIITSRYANFLPENLQKEYNDADINAHIIHFVQKPWKGAYYNSNFEYFWKYATRTPFIKIIIKRMKEEEFITSEYFHEQIISNITHRKGISLRFILFDCVKAWLFRDKPVKIST